MEAIVESAGHPIRGHSSLSAGAQNRVHGTGRATKTVVDPQKKADKPNPDKTTESAAARRCTRTTAEYIRNQVEMIPHP